MSVKIIACCLEKSLVSFKTQILENRFFKHVHNSTFEDTMKRRGRVKTGQQVEIAGSALQGNG